MLEYIGDEGEFGMDVEDDWNEQPSNELIDDEDDEYHDASTVGDEEFDPTYYDNSDQYVDHHEDYISDWDIYRGF